MPAIHEMASQSCSADKFVTARHFCIAGGNDVACGRTSPVWLREKSVVTASKLARSGRDVAAIHPLDVGHKPANRVCAAASGRLLWTRDSPP